MLFSGGLNLVFKIFFTGPRPYWMGTEVKALWGEIYFGIPSGHAQNSVAVWGTMAAFLRRRWAWVVAVFLMLMIGLSRTFLGAHFFVDMFAGWLIGALLLWLFVRYWDSVAQWAARQTLGRQILYAFLVSFGLIILGWIGIAAAGDFELPESWITNAARAGDEELAPFTMNGIITSAATLFGLLSGIAWMAPRGGWQVTGPVWKRALRYVVGLLGVLVIWYGLGLVFPRGETLVPAALRFVRYALLGIWVSAGGPLLFTKLKFT
jgi:hypothetical protein